MAQSQNSYLKNQRAKQKKQERTAKLERKHNKKNTTPRTDIHDMSNLERPESLGFLPEERFPQTEKKKETKESFREKRQ